MFPFMFVYEMLEIIYETVVFIKQPTDKGPSLTTQHIREVTRFKA